MTEELNGCYGADALVHDGEVGKYDGVLMLFRPFHYEGVERAVFGGVSEVSEGEG